MKPRLQHHLRTLPLALAAVVLAGELGAAVPAAAASETCAPPDPAVCYIRCQHEKRRCLAACTARKRQCLQGVRAELKACKLGCRNDDAAAADGVSVCKRRCVSDAIQTARRQCKLGKPVCVRRCHPEGCRALCHHRDAGDATVEPGGAVSPDQAEPATPAAVDATGDGQVCEPPADRECLGACADDLRSCAERVRAAASQCLAGCRGLEGEDRWLCVRDCATTAREQGGVCKQLFRECVGGCSPSDDPAENGGGDVPLAVE